MHKTISEIDRVTISLPHAIEEQHKSRLHTIAAAMAEEYRSNRELIACTALDAEDFDTDNTQFQGGN